MQSVPITTKSCAFESRSWRGVLDTTLHDKVCQVGGFLQVSSINITDRHNITEILLKVVFNTITLTRLLDRHSVNYEDDKLTNKLVHKTINFVNQFIIFFPHEKNVYFYQHIYI